MANCPKCGYKLRIFDIKAECPKCGVNLMYYNHQERLTEDADMAEEEHIKLQPKIDRIKFSFAGTKLAIVRLISLFIPIGMLFLPLAHISVQLPHKNIDTDISILNLATDVVPNMKFDVLFAMISESALTRVAFIFYLVSILGVFLAAVIAILNIPFDSVSASPKGFKRNIALSSCGIGFMLLSIVSFFVFNSQLSSSFGAIYSGNIGIGAFLAVIGFAIIIGINIAIKKQNVPVKYKDLSEYIERIEKRKAETAELEARVRAMQAEAKAVAKSE